MKKKKKETATGNIAQFQHKLGGDPDEGFKDEEDFEEYYKKYKASKKKKKAVKESEIQAGKEYIIWGIPKGEKYEQPLYTKAKDMSQAKRIMTQIEKRFGATKLRIQVLDLTKEPDFRNVFGESVSKKGKLDMFDDPRTTQTDRENARIGGSWSPEPPTPRCLKGEVWDDEKQMCVLKSSVKEATVSGQGASASPRVAGTDTRFGGPSFEPVFFEEESPENDAIRNEKVFYRDDNEPVLLPDWTYAEDLEDLQFSDQEVETPELLDDGDENSGIDRKEKTGIAWELDTFDNKYKKLLQRLRKQHNI